MRILIVDDHPLVREGLSAVLSTEASIERVDQAATVEEAMEKIREAKPELVLLDLRLSGRSGLDIIPLVKAQGMGKGCKFIILTSFADQDDFQKAEQLEVDGYILKGAFPEEILLAMRLVSRGRKYYDPGMLDFLVKKQDEPIIEELTPREQEVLKALGKGLNNRDIAKSLFITEYTVKKHVSQILSKLALADRTQAALYASSKGIV